MGPVSPVMVEVNLLRLLRVFVTDGVVLPTILRTGEEGSRTVPRQGPGKGFPGVSPPPGRVVGRATLIDIGRRGPCPWYPFEGGRRRWAREGWSVQGDVTHPHPRG